MEAVPFGHDLFAFGGEKKKGGDLVPGKKKNMIIRIEGVTGLKNWKLR